ncbi:2-oxo acid dehydrogenase subunit E2 [Fulvivirga sp. 29W222]|uniref:Dihydrolipoamide acetyltransferase component of pyruvate dehydrogenase complex n=1 Tax=Fulvivirga marina TaxID=2494733 RepID=A0A937G0Y2_9BACT|nr:dihydrolipoamide acetyltransferase family protein [Fulvivirga marina]MBL6448073.1 2-oxo acid dehydrogenase subunit E2 [Fulvivirga marina]
MIEFTMPSLGADMEAGTLREWHIEPGDYIEHGDIIADVETQKGIIEVECFDEGVVEKLLIKEDEKVPVGTVMALINPVGGEEREEAVVHEKPEKMHETRREPVPHVVSPVVEHHRIKISPLARKMAEENHVDYTVIKGSGEKGAIVKEDIEKAISQEEEQPKSTEEKPGTTTNFREAIAAAMTKSNREIPHYYLEIKVDMSKSLDWLAERNKQRQVKERILPIALLIKAVAKALQQVPDLNATWENGLVKKPEINPGLVISLRTGGIVVPAVRQADRKSIEEIMETLNNLIPRARSFKLRSSEISDGTVSITSLGEGGADRVYGVIYPPQVALIGLGSIKNEPWVENDMLGIRPVLSITLAADHRATDGHTGDRFLKALRQQLLNPEVL